MPKTVAFYLPQFHPIPENDEWWGKGFTEWTNVRQAKPLFSGHYQPHVPHKSIGYYDLRDTSFLIKQHRLAKRYGIYGFCYYYYYFNGKTLLDLPLKTIRSTPEIPTHYCLCWANGNWTRAWYGQNKEILMANTYTPEYALDFIKKAHLYFTDDRYIRIDGKPLLLVFQPEDIPNIKKYSEIWRDYCLQHGFPGLYLASVEAFLLGVTPDDYGFDAAVEFAPDWSRTHRISEKGTKPRIFDYAETVKKMLLKPEPSYVRYNCIFPGWDNTPRYKKSAIAFINNSQGAFKFFAEKTLHKTKLKFPSSNQFMFINAWNEWGEGCHMEPDERNGYTYLQILREVLQNS